MKLAARRNPAAPRVHAAAVVTLGRVDQGLFGAGLQTCEFALEWGSTEDTREREGRDGRGGVGGGGGEERGGEGRGASLNHLAGLYPCANSQ